MDRLKIQLYVNKSKPYFERQLYVNKSKPYFKRQPFNLSKEE